MASDRFGGGAATEFPASVIGDALLTHGTLESGDLRRARRAYEQFFGLRVVHHSKVAQLIAGKYDVGVISVFTGKAVHEQGAENRWLVLTPEGESLTVPVRQGNDGTGRGRSQKTRTACHCRPFRILPRARLRRELVRDLRSSMAKVPGSIRLRRRDTKGLNRTGCHYAMSQRRTIERPTSAEISCPSKQPCRSLPI